jgi:hypothetical protein
VAPAACRAGSVAEAIENRMAIAVVVAHREAFAVGMDGFGMVAALHTGWVAVVGHPGLYHSLYKIADRRLTRRRNLGSDARTFVT